MEKEMEKKIKKNKFNLIIIIILIILILSGISLAFFISNPSEELTSENDSLEEYFSEEVNSPIISVVIPDESNKNDLENNTFEEATPESNDNVNQIDTSSPVSNNNTDTSSNTNIIQNTNSNSNTHSNSSTNTNQNSNLNSGSSTSSSSNSNSNSNSNTGTSSEPTTPPAPETKPYKVKTETSKEVTKSQTKYGVIINTYTTSTYDLYSDGSKKVISSYDTIEYDRSNYNATTSELLPEAKSAKNQYSSMINQVFKNVNGYRLEANTNSVDGVTTRSNLSLDENLCIAASARAIEMAYSSKFSHTRPNGSNCFSLIKEMGITYKTAGENIAYGYSTADAASEGWKNSQGHYTNMISPNFSKIGIGVFKIENTYYWVQFFN